jgi:hypothetical protein
MHQMKYYGSVRAVSLPPVTTTQIAGPSDNRVALLFSPPLSGSYTVSTDPNLTSNGGGINLLPTSSPVVITPDLYGDAVTKPWYANASAQMSVGVLETIHD